MGLHRQVLDWTQTGFARDYGRNPYVEYDDPDAEPFLFRGVVDDRERAMQRVVGISVHPGHARHPLGQVQRGLE